MDPIQAPATPPPAPWRSRFSNFVGWIRDAWLVLGLTLALCVGLEVLYRTQALIRRPATTVERVAVEEDGSWFPDYLAEEKAAKEAQRWSPYVYFRTEPFVGRHINIDASGLRRTVQTEVPGAPEVFVFGGSTMFGTFQRDEWTIPSVLSRQFAACGGEAQFRNLGLSGRVFTQEVLDLVVRLRDGAKPRVVVFYDGINDVIAMIQNARPGWPQNEHNRARDFKLGSTVFRWETNVRSEVAAAGYLMLAGVTRSQLLQRVRPFSIPVPPFANGNAAPGTGAESLALSYAATMRLVEALAREFSFTPLYVWQPTIHSTRKPLTENEGRLLRAIQAERHGTRVLSLHRDIARAVDAPARAVAGERFLNLSGVFDNEREPVFADNIGHTYEKANEALGKAILPAVAKALRSALPQSTINARCVDTEDGRS